MMCAVAFAFNIAIATVYTKQYTKCRVSRPVNPHYKVFIKHSKEQLGNSRKRKLNWLPGIKKRCYYFQYCTGKRNIDT